MRSPKVTYTISGPEIFDLQLQCSGKNGTLDADNGRSMYKIYALISTGKTKKAAKKES
jgi:hypothetical protein